MRGGTLEPLWLRRASAFREEIVPYVRYVGQSGFLLFLSLIFITFAISYAKLIRDVPEGFPVTPLGIAALLLVLCWSPLRTWLTPADVVFLMPREGQMRPYLARSFRRAAIQTVLLTAAVLLLYLPIYRQGPGQAPGWALAVFAAVIRAFHLWGGWRERRLAWPGMRAALRLVRWAATALALWAALTAKAWQAAPFLLLLGALLALLYRLPASHRMPWERLIAEEAATRRRYYAFFGLFADVPTLPPKTAGRAYLSWLLGLIRYRHRHTFVYLYAGSLIRTETAGILLRLLVLFGLIVYWLSDAVWLSGWGAAAFYAVFVLLMAMQLGGLRHVHRHTVWRHVYPLPDSRRIAGLVAVDRAALTACAALLWLPAGLTLLAKGQPLPAAAMPAAAALYIGLIRPGRLKRKAAAEAEDED